MPPKGPILRIIPTPWPLLPSVDLHQKVFEEHIVRHGITDLSGIVSVVSCPRVIVPGTGTGRPGHYIFVGPEKIRDDGSLGAPLTVIVNAPERYVCTAYPNSSFKVINQGRVLWPLDT